MTGCKKYYKIPILTKLFKIRFYIKWIDDNFHHIGFDKDYGCKMTLGEAIERLESKRLYRENFNN